MTPSQTNHAVRLAMIAHRYSRDFFQRSKAVDAVVAMAEADMPENTATVTENIAAAMR